MFAKAGADLKESFTGSLTLQDVFGCIEGCLEFFVHLGAVNEWRAQVWEASTVLSHLLRGFRVVEVQSCHNITRHQRGALPSLVVDAARSGRQKRHHHFHDLHKSAGFRGRRLAVLSS